MEPIDLTSIVSLCGQARPASEQRLAIGLKCPECRQRLETMYGYCRFGLGTFDLCNPCHFPFNFDPEEDED